jgi:hypothetical protein
MITIRKKMIDKNNVFTGSFICNTLETNLKTPGNTDRIMKLKLVNIQVSAYLSSNLFILTILKIQTKKAEEAMIKMI